MVASRHVPARFVQYRSIPEFIIWLQIVVRNTESKIYLAVKHRNSGKDMNAALSDLGIAIAPTGEKHTPHDCRHTFSALCEKYEVKENDREANARHSFVEMLQTMIYGHRTWRPPGVN